MIALLPTDWPFKAIGPKFKGMRILNLSLYLISTFKLNLTLSFKFNLGLTLKVEGPGKKEELQRGEIIGLDLEGLTIT